MITKPKLSILFFLLIVVAMLNLGMAKLAPHYAKVSGPRYFLVLLKKEAAIYQRSYLNYPDSLEKLEEDMKRRYANNIDFFDRAKGQFHTYKIVESSPNFFRARSLNDKKYPDYEITSMDDVPLLITQRNTT